MPFGPFKSVFDTVGDAIGDIGGGILPIAAGVGVGIATGNPYAGFATYGALSATEGYHEGRNLERYGRRYEQQQIALANEYADLTRQQGLAAQRAAEAAAAAAHRQAALLAEAAAKAREIAAANAQLVLDEGKEVLRRTKATHRQVEGETTARQWASGFLANRGSMEAFSAKLSKENKAQQSWINRSYKQQAEVVREGGEIQAASLDAQAQGVASGAAQLAAQGAAAYAQANLQADQAIAQAQFSGDRFIQQGKDAQSGSLANLALSLGSIAAGLNFGKGATTTASKAGSGKFGPFGTPWGGI